VFAMSRSLFSHYFTGNTEAYGKYIPPSNSAEEGVKEEGTCYTIDSVVTEQQYSEHLAGTTGLGICPVNAAGECKFTVIDVDEYEKLSTQYILKMIKEFDFPLLPFLSKSGGLHLYTFYEEFVKADVAKANAEHMRRCLNLLPTTEIFPKQTKIQAGNKGSWINLPYFGGDRTKRYIIEDASPVQTVDAAVDAIKKKITTLELFQAWKETLPLNDAPPCLQTIYMKGTTGSRNNYLFNLACYFKAKYEDQFPTYLEEANEMLDKPLSQKELRDTIVSSITKNSYTYRCKESPICDLCDKRECRTRTYAVGDAISDLSYETLVQYTVDPPYYEWTVSGKVLRFYSEQEIIQQEKFRALCMRHLGLLPRKLKMDTWSDIVNVALLHMEIVTVDSGEDITDSGQVRSLVGKFLKEMKSDQQSKLLLGRVYYKKEKGTLYFRGVDLVKFISTRVGYGIDKRQLYAWLVEKGVTASVMKVNTKSVRVYVAPASSFYEFDDEGDAPEAMITQKDVEAVDWSKEDKEGDY